MLGIEHIQGEWQVICLHCGNRCHEVGESVFRCSVCNKDFEQSSWDFELEETESLSGGSVEH